MGTWTSGQSNLSDEEVIDRMWKTHIPPSTEQMVKESNSLTIEDLKQICLLYTDGTFSKGEMAWILDVSPLTIHMIIISELWKHLDRKAG